MWNRGFRIIWVKVHITGSRYFYINLPVSLSVFEELMDCLADLLALACLFIPKNPPSQMRGMLPARAAKDLIESTNMLLRTVTDQEPYDLVEVNVENVTVAIKIR
jgi:hypothetical protein